MSFYVPGTEEKDPKKVIMSLQQAASNTATNTTDIATNTADIATNAADIATNTADIANRVVGPSSATDNALARFNGTTGKLVQDSEITLGDSDGKLTRTAGISISGTNTNDSAASGYVGEENKTSFASISLTTGTAANVTSLSVPAGDFEIMATLTFSGAGGTSSSDWNSLISTTSTPSVAGANSITGFVYHTRLPAGLDITLIHTHMPWRVSNASTTTYYLHANATFITSTYGVSGILRYRRVR